MKTKSLILTAILTLLFVRCTWAQENYEYSILRFYPYYHQLLESNDNDKKLGLKAIRTDLSKLKFNDSIEAFFSIKNVLDSYARRRWEVYAEEDNSTSRDLFVYYIRKNKNWKWQPQKEK